MSEVVPFGEVVGDVAEGLVEDEAARRAALSPEEAEDLRALIDVALDLAESSLAPSTRSLYERRWAAVRDWCARKRLAAGPMTEATLVAYVADLARRDPKPALSTVEGYLAAIKWGLARDGHPYPKGVHLERVVQGYARKVGRAPKRQATALRKSHLPMLRAAMDFSRPRDVRDWAMILLDFYGGFRRSELVGIEAKDVSVNGQDGIVVWIPKSKADQEGRGRRVPIPYQKDRDVCPVRAFHAWTRTSEIREGRIFREVRPSGRLEGEGITDQVVADVIRDRALAAGLPGKWSGHSGRRGFVTESAARGKRRTAIARHGGWKPGSTQVEKYAEEGEQFNSDNPARWDDEE